MSRNSFCIVSLNSSNFCIKQNKLCTHKVWWKTTLALNKKLCICRGTVRHAIKDEILHLKRRAVAEWPSRTLKVITIAAIRKVVYEYHTYILSWAATRPEGSQHDQRVQAAATTAVDTDSLPSLHLGDLQYHTSLLSLWSSEQQDYGTHTHTTHNHFTALLEYVRDHPGEQVLER